MPRHDQYVQALRSDGLQRALTQERLRRDRLNPSLLWRIGVITPRCDDARGPLRPDKVAAFGRHPRGMQEEFAEVFGPIALSGTDGVFDSLRAVATMAQDRLWERRILRTVDDGWLLEHMVRSRADSNGLLTVPEGVEIATGPGQYIGLRDFLWDAGFPITPPPAAPGIFTMEVSGLAGVSPTGAVGIWRDPYFLHRSLVDDQGSAICLGLDEDIENANNLPFTARLEPCVGKELPERIARRRLVPPGWQPGHSPLVRYVYYPLPATMTLPLIDAPVISNQWVDLFLYPDGAGLAFIPRPGRERDEPGPRLSELWGYHLHKKNHRLLGLTHDKDHVMEYLDAKMRILAEAFEIIRFPP